MGFTPVSVLEALFSALPGSTRQWPSASEENAAEKLQQLVGSFWMARVLYVVAKLGIADLLNAGLQRSDELALATGTHAPSLYRLLHALVSVGVFAEEAKDSFALTPISHKLRSDIPDSLRPFVLVELGEDQYHTGGHIVQNAKVGKPSRKSTFSPHAKQESPRFRKEPSYFDQGLGSVAARVHAAVLNAYNFSSAGTLVDVGGGDGTFLAFLLQAHEELRGVLVEQPHVIESARCRLAAEGVSKRCKVIAGDFFEFLPRKGDTYILKWIVSDYEDARAVRILTNCRRAMPPTGKLLLIDAVVPVDNLPSFLKLQDVNRLASSWGRERTADEFCALFHQAGLRITEVLPACPEASIIEAVREESGAETCEH